MIRFYKKVKTACIDIKILPFFRYASTLFPSITKQIRINALRIPLFQRNPQGVDIINKASLFYRAGYKITVDRLLEAKENYKRGNNANYNSGKNNFPLSPVWSYKSVQGR